MPQLRQLDSGVLPRSFGFSLCDYLISVIYVVALEQILLRVPSVSPASYHCTVIPYVHDHLSLRRVIAMTNQLIVTFSLFKVGTSSWPEILLMTVKQNKEVREMALRHGTWAQLLNTNWQLSLVSSVLYSFSNKNVITGIHTLLPYAICWFTNVHVWTGIELGQLWWEPSALTPSDGMLHKDCVLKAIKTNKCLA
jgi:hypothetical protein